MPMPRFSVVIPTRDRAEALRHTLQTCLTQDCDDYEIVVCDNHSGSATRQVVEEMSSSRIRYVRSPRPLVPSALGELAVSSAAGEYVTILGQGGLLGHALRELDRLLRQLRVPVIRWTPASYHGSYLRIPLGRELRSVEARPAIASVVGFRADLTTLPLLSNAVSHRGLFDLLRAHTGRLFAGRFPDEYSGVALGYLSGSFISTEVPMTVASVPAPVNEERPRPDEGSPLPHPAVPDLPISPVAVADSFLRAREALFPGDAELHLDRRLLSAKCAEELRVKSPAAWRLALDAIRAALADDPAAQKWFEANHAYQPFRPAPPVNQRPPRLGYVGGCLHLDAEEFGVEEVCGAAALCDRILEYRGGAVDYDMRDLPRGGMAQGGRRLAA
jgi:hypothetical protein